jgi:hypothetical protein
MTDAPIILDLDKRDEEISRLTEENGKLTAEKRLCQCGSPQSDFPYHEHSREREIVNETLAALREKVDGCIKEIEKKMGIVTTERLKIPCIFITVSDWNDFIEALMGRFEVNVNIISSGEIPESCKGYVAESHAKMCVATRGTPKPEVKKKAGGKA